MKLSIISLAIVVTLAFLGRHALAAEPAGVPPKPGDGQHSRWILVYKVDEQKTVWRPEKLDSLVDVIRRRINPDGRKEISVKSLGTNMVQIDMPSVNGGMARETKAAKAEEIRKIIRTTGALEFRIVAAKRDNESLIEIAKAERKKYPVDPVTTVRIYGPNRVDPKTGKPLELAKWVRVRDKQADKVKGDEGAMPVGKHMVKGEHGKQVEKEAWDVLVLSPDPDADVTGEDVRDARVAQDTETGLPEVSFSFSSQGGAKFSRLTGRHLPQSGGYKYHLAIVLDDELIIDPVINSVIRDSARITGSFTQQEVREIAAIIKGGALPAALEPTPVRDTIIEGAASK